MGLSFNASRQNRQREGVVAVDLGSRTSKAVHLQRRNNGYALLGYALLDAPIYEKTLSPELLAEHLKALNQAVDAKTRSITLTLGVNDVVVRHAELPRMPVEDMRMVLKLNSKNYLQQELANHVYDCHLLPIAPAKGTTEAPKTAAGQIKQRVLVAGAKRQTVEDLVAGARTAGFSTDAIFPALISPANTFEQAMPDAFVRDVVALVDIGFKNTSICIVQQGEVVLSRVVHIGGDKLTNGLAETLSISYAEAEGIKVGMPTEVTAQLEQLVIPLGRELRASIDFFEHQHDRAVSQVFVTGGSARSEFIIQRLAQDLMLDCQLLNPLANIQLQLNPQQTAEVEQVAPQLAVALGAALAAL